MAHRLVKPRTTLVHQSMSLASLTLPECVELHAVHRALATCEGRSIEHVIPAWVTALLASRGVKLAALPDLIQQVKEDALGGTTPGDLPPDELIVYEGVLAGEVDLHEALWDATAFACTRFKLLKLLVARGGNVNTVDAETGWTPLHVAAMNDKLELALYLIRVGADVTTKCPVRRHCLFDVRFQANAPPRCQGSAVYGNLTGGEYSAALRGAVGLTRHVLPAVRCWV